MLLFRGTFFAAFLVTLGGCGFQPLYQKQQASDAVIDDLAQVQVLNLIDQVNHDDRLGQKVKNFLLDRLNPGGRPGNPFYVLAVEVGESTTELGVKFTDEATRAKLSMNAIYTLTEKKTNAVLFRGNTRSVNSYNIVKSDFATLSAENNAKDRAAREIADDIKLRLGIFFNELRSGT
jgi:LPS-assembly lipoprotein